MIKPTTIPGRSYGKLYIQKILWQTSDKFTAELMTNLQKSYNILNHRLIATLRFTAQLRRISKLILRSSVNMAADLLDRVPLLAVSTNLQLNSLHELFHRRSFRPVS